MWPKNRISHFWFLLWLSIILFVVVILYNVIIEMEFFHFSPSQWTTIDNIYKTLCGTIITAMVANIVSFIFREIKYDFGSEHAILRRFLPTLRFMSILVIWIIGGFVILESLHINTNGLLAGAGIGGAVFAIASRDIIANILGSLSLILSKAFEIGDSIRIKNYEGVVEEITMSYTRIMDISGKLVYIPNRIINGEALENLSRRRFVLYTYKVPFKKASSDPEIIKDTLMIMEGKIAEYDPIKIDISTDIPNANDFVYIFDVAFPSESPDFDREIREFMIPYIFRKEST